MNLLTGLTGAKLEKEYCNRMETYPAFVSMKSGARHGRVLAALLFVMRGMGLLAMLLAAVSKISLISVRSHNDNSFPGYDA